MIPFGKAKVVQPGTDLTVVTYGAVVPRALQAAQKLEREQGVKVELIDLRCLNPFDWDAIAASVAKTNRALVAYEDTLSWGYGAEIAARIADELFSMPRSAAWPQKMCLLPTSPFWKTQFFPSPTICSWR
jgi:2-oxoisovalerate dehydrogenase E1 component